MPTYDDNTMRVHARMDEQPMPSDEDMDVLYAAILSGDMQ